MTKALSTPVAQAVPPLASVVTFISYVLDDNELTAATAFTTMSLFFLIRMPFVILPMAVPALAECLVAFERFSQYFELETVIIPPRNACDPEKGGSISITNGNFKYTSQLTGDEEKEGSTKEDVKPAAARKEDNAVDGEKDGRENGANQEAENEVAKSASRPTLEGINLEVGNRELCVVVGGVGSGKSSLIAAILDEIPCLSGKASLQVPIITERAT